MMLLRGALGEGVRGGDVGIERESRRGKAIVGVLRGEYDGVGGGG